MHAKLITCIYFAPLIIYNNSNYITKQMGTISKYFFNLQTNDIEEATKNGLMPVYL